jgi:Uma2 family endonuclease
MPTMSSPTSPSEVVNAVRHLPVGATLVVHDFTWDDYERLVEDLGDHSPVHVSYDRGRLEILSPSYLHDKYSWFLNLLVAAFCEARGINVCGCGQTTWKMKSVGKGVEADASFYVTTQVPNDRNLDLEIDPPPDICVEIDLTTDSPKKFPVYAGLGVPEVWVYDKRAFRFYSLMAGKYSRVERSSFLVGLTDRMLTEAMETCKAGPTLEVVKSFRTRVKKLRLDQ